MECNKEEAIRAKSIAESRMQNKDFEGALKVALKAQALFPELESISQILAVCEVHCAASTKMMGLTDWYGILQVEMTSDESTIKKQYRKLALLLHPDKNKLAGAEGAFQQVGDAYKILSDPRKRSQHDMVRRANFSGVLLNQASRQSYRPSTKKQPGPGVSNTAAKSSFAHFSGMNQDQASSFSRAQVFDSFVAHDSKTQGEPTTENLKKNGSSHPLTATKTDCFNACTMESQRTEPVAFNQVPKLEHGPDFFCEPKDNIRHGNVDDDLINCNEIKFQKVQLQPIRNEEKAAKPLKSPRNIRNDVTRTVEMSVDRTNSLRRSNRQTKNDTCDEVQGDFMDSKPPSKRARQGEKEVDSVQMSNAFPGVIADGDREGKGNSHFHAENLSYPSEFSNFKGEKSESKFAVDQIWAIYDNIDGMPRLYARVRKVYSRGFKLQLSWLEKDPRTITEMKWSQQGLPVACGSFKLGKSFNTQDRKIFSHLVQWRKGMKRNSYIIYPRKGEIWAMFSNWDIKWISEPNNQRVYKYEIVEVVSDFSETNGMSVIRLAKIKEFMTLFVRTEESLVEISAKEVLKISHRIPACRMTGKEEDGLAEGAFELDSASLPKNIKVNLASISIKVTKSETQNDGSVCDSVCFDSITGENKISQPEMENMFDERLEQNAMEKLRSGRRSSPLKKKMNSTYEMVTEVSTEADNMCSQKPNPENSTAPTTLLSFEYPESEFYDFESDRIMEKFESGQIWAFYCEIDNFPKYYGRIGSVDRKNNQVHVRWLGVCPALDEDDNCAEDKSPPACGAFIPVNEKCTMDSGETFSHLVKAKPMATKNHYHIYPDVGEVWAVFKNELKNSELDIVEILACDDVGITGLNLTKVEGYVSVFKRGNEGDGLVKFIAFHECLKFSHRIPAYQLTKEMGSSSYWELDPAAVPTVFLTSKS